MLFIFMLCLCLLTQFVYFIFLFPSCTVLLICLFFLILCSHRCCFLSFIFRLPMSSSITIHLKSLHWLPVKVRSTYKIASLCYHCHSSTAPSYVTDMLHKKPLHTRNTRSCSYTMPLLNRPAHSKATLGDRSFSFASSSVWDSIPNDVRCAPSLSSFKSRLKTYLFRSVYKD